MITDLANLDVGLVGRFARDLESAGPKRLFVFAVELIAVTVTLANFSHAVGALRQAALGEHAGPSAQSHGAPQFVDALQLAELENHAVRGGGIELGRIGALEAADVAGVLDHHGLHAKADAEVRNLVLARVADGVDHAFDAALAEPTGHQDAIVRIQGALRVGRRDAFGFNPVDVDLQLVRQAAVQQRFLQALVRIFVFHILAHQADRNLARGILHAVKHLAPPRKMARTGFELQT